MERFNLPKRCKVLNKDLAFIIGVALGDGHISGRTIFVIVKDKDFAETFAKTIKMWCGKIVKVKK